MNISNPIQILDNFATALTSQSLVKLVTKAGAYPHACDMAKSYNRNWVSYWLMMDNSVRSDIAKLIANANGEQVIHALACTLNKNNGLIDKIAQKAGLSEHACTLGGVYRQPWAIFWQGIGQGDKQKFITYLQKQ